MVDERTKAAESGLWFSPICKERGWMGHPAGGSKLRQPVSWSAGRGCRKRIKRGPGGPRDSRPGGQRYDLLPLRRGCAALYYHADMRKTTFVQPLSCRFSLFCLLALSLYGPPAFAQGTAPDTYSVKEAPLAIPTDPKELMLMAAKLNTLTGDEVKPWHLKASFNLLDEKGNSSDQGTYEEFWVSPTKFKRIYAGTTFTQTDFGTDHGVMRISKQSGVPYLVSEMRRKLVEPMQNSKVIDIESYSLQQNEIGKAKLNCLSMKDFSGSSFGPIWCLDADKPILRMTGTPQGAQVLRRGLVGFQGHYVAKDVVYYQSGRTVLTAHIDLLESIPTYEESLFQPTSDAVKMIGEGFKNGIIPGFVINKVTPDRPANAKELGASGTVILKGIIGKDGHVRDISVTSGPKIFQQAALDAAKQWIYRPYLLNNEPVEVDTTININF
jgi:TonB family protein